LLGAFAGVLHASRDLREGQLRQYKVLLADATSQRASLSNKSSLAVNVADKSLGGITGVAMPTQPPDQTAVGSSPWQVDPSPMKNLDLGTGAYFNILPNGQILQFDLATRVPCEDPSLPDGSYCREVLLTAGLPTANGAILPAGVRAYTLWTRIARKGDPIENAVVQQKVLIP